MAKSKTPGMYWFVDDWLSDEGVQACGYAAQGFWFELLNHMHKRHPRGVLPGSLIEIAKLKGLRGKVAEVWAGYVTPLVRELEANEVFSRGRDMPGALAPDAIVNRKMYRDYHLRDNRRAAAEKRWERERAAKNKVNVQCKKGTKPHANPHAKAMQNPIREGMQTGMQGNPDGATGYPQNSDAKPMQTAVQSECLSSPNPSPNPQVIYKSGDPDDPKREGNDHGESRNPSPGSPCAQSPQPDGFQARRLAMLTYVTTLEQLTGDTAWRKQEWRDCLYRIAGDDKAAHQLQALFERLETNVNPHLAQARGHDYIEEPAQFAAAEIMRIDQKL